MGLKIDKHPSPCKTGKLGNSKGLVKLMKLVSLVKLELDVMVGAAVPCFITVSTNG